MLSVVLEVTVYVLHEPAVILFCVYFFGLFGDIQGRRRLLESGIAIEHRWCSPSADGTRGERGREGGLTPPFPKGGLEDLPQENFVIQDD